MAHVPLSHHADLRCAQRGIENSVIQFILDQGRAVYDHHGGCRYFLGQAEKRRLARSSPELVRHYGRKLDLVVVLTAKGRPKVITAFVRNRRR